MNSRLVAVAGLFMAGVLGSGLVASSASAASSVARNGATVRPDTGWLGACSRSAIPGGGGGWCDGNGPDATYYGWISCLGNGFNGYIYGPTRWAGDRRGSFATCPFLSVRLSYGVTGTLA